MLYLHDGVEDFPHGAGPAPCGFYYYTFAIIRPEPSGPFVTAHEAVAAGMRWEAENPNMQWRT